MLQVEFAPKVLAPDALKQRLNARYAQMKADVIPGEELALPEADWPGMKVHRVESAVKLNDARAGAGSPAPSTRIHFDGYLIQFGQSASVLAIATTNRDAVAAYRREVEQILKSIQVNPGRPASD